jgi:hypothetical protein
LSLFHYIILLQILKALAFYAINFEFQDAVGDLAHSNIEYWSRIFVKVRPEQEKIVP